MNSLQQQSNNETFSFREITGIAKSYYLEIKSRRNILLAIMALCVIIGIISQLMNKKQFVAEVSFMINEEQSSGNVFSGAFGQFGNLLGLGTDVNLQKILELAKSRRIAEKVFFAKSKINEKEELIANQFIGELESNGQWIKSGFLQKKSPLSGFRFQNFDPGRFNTLENLALKQLHALFLKTLSTEVSEKTSIMKLTIQFTDEQLTYELANRLFDEMSNFYIDKMVERQRETWVGLKQKTDSLKALIETKQYQLAGIRDKYRATWLYHEEVPKTILDQEIKMLQVVYGESLKNREMASFALETRTPFIQAIDLPILPLKVIHRSWLNTLILSVIYGLFIGSFCVIIPKFYRDQMK